MLEVRIGLVNASEPVLALFDTDVDGFAQKERLKPRGSVLDNMLNGQGRSERILAVVAGESKACGNGVGNVDPCQSKSQLCGPLTSRIAASAAFVPENTGRGKFQPPEPPRNVGHLLVGTCLANSSTRSHTACH